MTSLVCSSPAWRSPPKIILALAFLVSQVAAQAAAPTLWLPQAAAPTLSLPQAAALPPLPPRQANPKDLGPVVVSSERGKTPHKHRETKRAQVKPEKQPSQPQPTVHSLE